MAKEDLKPWKPGQSGNPAGRPKGAGKPISKLRQTLKKLQEMETKALENIKNSVDGKEMDKEVLATSKWVITTMVTVNRAATADEALKHEIKMDEKEEQKANGTNGAPVRPRFSTSLVADEE